MLVYLNINIIHFFEQKIIQINTRLLQKLRKLKIKHIIYCFLCAKPCGRLATSTCITSCNKHVGFSFGKCLSTISEVTIALGPHFRTCKSPDLFANNLQKQEFLQRHLSGAQSRDLYGDTLQILHRNSSELLQNFLLVFTKP